MFDISDTIEAAANSVQDLHDKTVVRSALWALAWKTKTKWDDRLFSAFGALANFIRTNPGTVKAFADRVENMVNGEFGAESMVQAVGAPYGDPTTPAYAADSAFSVISEYI